MCLPTTAFDVTSLLQVLAFSEESLVGMSVLEDAYSPERKKKNGVRKVYDIVFRSLRRSCDVNFER